MDIKRVASADPGAGAEATHTVPADVWWVLMGLQVALVTSATAANRRPALVIDDGAVEFDRLRAGVDQAASLTRTYTFTPSVVAEVDRSATFLEMIEPLAKRVLPGGYRIRTVTQALQAGDNYGVMQMFVAELDSLRDAIAALG